MKKLDIYGGLLGAGKTTLIKKMLTAAYQGSRTAIIENEIGKVNLDAQEFPNLQVRPLTSGCVCCTLRGDMISAVQELLWTVDPDYVIIEATGAADLLAIREICARIREIRLNRCIMLVNAKKVRALLKVVGEFYYAQLAQADTIYLNFTESLAQEEIRETEAFLSGINPQARIVSVPLSEIRKDTFPDRIPEPDTDAGLLRDTSADGNPGGAEEPEPDAGFLLKKQMPASGKYRLEVKEADGSSPRIMPHDPYKTTLYTWTYEVKEPFTEKTLHDFWNQVKEREIWRVKGLVSMADGTTRKLDYAFGDIFEEEKETEDTSVVNKIVLIGKQS